MVRVRVRVILGGDSLTFNVNPNRETMKGRSKTISSRLVSVLTASIEISVS